MRGLSEEDIKRFIRAHNIDNEHNWIAGLLLEECHELDPWLPIESAPKDRTILGFVSGKKRLIRWGKTSHIPIYGFCLADQGSEDFDICNPTHYKELPKDPTCDNSSDT